jgi:phosphatidylinositol glycan class W
MDAYKAQKEAFVSNLSGGSIMEINVVTLVASISVLLWSALQSRLSFFKPYTAASLAVDFLLNVGAILFATTLYSNAPLLLNILLILPVILLLLRPKRTRGAQKAKPPRPANNQNGIQGRLDGIQKDPVHPFLTSYRASMLVVTCISILAVDFPVFPRRFAKTENWGTSLMDLGVGSFVFSGGVVSARSVLRMTSSPETTYRQRLIGSVRHSIPLLLLGFLRLYSVKGLDYPEHVTEYGVHWNFFFTLGFLPLFVEVFHTLSAMIPSYEALPLRVAAAYQILSLFIVAAYQVALESTDLKPYILVSPRGPDLLSLNREGIFSFAGYLSIFLAGRSTGLWIFSYSKLLAISSQQARKWVLLSLASLTAFWTVLFVLNSTYAFGYGARIPVSRRLANMPYVLWVVAFNNAQILLFCLIETVLFPAVHQSPDRGTEAERSSFATSRVLAAFNKNGLPVFLIANLLTGAVNLSIHTLKVSNGQAMAILLAYGAAVTGIALALDVSNLKLKL